jgi:hypothetical protein
MDVLLLRTYASTGMFLPSRYIAMNVYSDFAIPAFGRHDTVYEYIIMIC